MANESKTENIVRDLLREKGYYGNQNIVIEEKASDNPKIQKLLKRASKNGAGAGYPEFIISFKDNPDDLIVIECKASISKHESKNRDKHKDYAVDGALLYASYLKDEFNTIAVAVSGENDKEKKISTFLWLRQNYTYKDIQDKLFLKSKELEAIVKQQSKPFAEEELIKKAIEYNSFLHKYSIPEVERCTLISAILIALQHKPFLHGYKFFSPVMEEEKDDKENKDNPKKKKSENAKLIDSLLTACESVLEKNNLDSEKTKIIISEYSKFRNNADFSSDTFHNKKTKKNELNTLLRDFISLINQDILPHINESEFDVLGKFYTQFIRYAGGDKKTGLVLTPSHITDFFCDIAELSADDIVFDPCCGTAGFLVSAMNYMIEKAGNNTEKKQAIKSKQLIGIEKRPDMFSHACSNMMMRGDGKSHILYGSCFDEKNKNIIKRQKPTKGFLNPPYQDGNADEQLEFVENTLECLVKDGVCVAICQMSTVVSDDKKVVEVKERLLRSHTLEAVFSMPNDLFHPVTVNTCIIVFKAHTPHSQNKKTFFGYFKDDGFVKTKNNGRIDKNKFFKKIKKQWLEKFLNKENAAGLSQTQNINAESEWCSEAYLETDYSNLKEENFIKVIKDFSIFQFSNNYISTATNKSLTQNKINLSVENWKFYEVNHLFPVIKPTKGSTTNELIPGNEIAYIAAKKDSNGLDMMCSKEGNKQFISEGNCIVFIQLGAGSAGYTLYQEKDFIGMSGKTSCGYNDKLNKYNSLFLVTILDQERPKFSFGRSWTGNRLTSTKIKLPATKQGDPDWMFMENYIKSLPYSSSL